jgi:bifunctional UDP-N-acetylglucosamine pyrophosphorylase/glucosamine-1-phosphate N-acetyltransferase
VGQDCVIRSGCRLSDSRLAGGVEVRDHSVVLESRIGSGAQVGPFAHLRPGTILEPHTRVGNFVELKKTRLGRASKASHLSYLGDATIGPDCNIGAGTITCNYDGVKKHPTVMGREVFIGSDTQIVAPVKLGDRAYVAAGATVTQDVPEGALAISRARQRNIEGWVDRRRKSGKKKR